MPTESARKKSCSSCRLAKTRCNLAIPKCSRCELRRLPCAYERNIFANASSGSDNPDLSAGPNLGNSARNTINSATRSSGSSSCLLATEELIEHADNFQATALQNPQPIALDVPLGQSLDNGLQRGLDLDWDFDVHSWPSARSLNGDGQLTTISEQSNVFPNRPTDTKGPEIGYFPSRQPHIPNPNPVAIDISHEFQGRGRSLSSPLTPWQALLSEGQDLVRNPPHLVTRLSSPGIPRLFLPRKFSTGSSLLTTKYLVAVLHSYPRFMMNNSIFPPYIHSYTPKSNGGDSNCNEDRKRTPESLAICSSIIQMALNKTRESHAFIWRTIRLEQQRLYEEVCGLDLHSLREGY